MSQSDPTQGKPSKKERGTGALVVSERQSGQDVALALTKLLKGQPPSNVQSLLNGVVEVSRSTDPALLMAMADAKRRYAGMWIAAGLAVAGIGGGVAILISAAPAIIGVGLLAFGAACAGAAFAIATGKSVELHEFSSSFAAAARGFSRGSDTGS